MKSPICMQMAPSENGLAALQSMLAHFKKYVKIEELRKTCFISRNGLTVTQILKSASIFGLDSEIKEIPLEELRNQKTPFMISWKRKFFAIVQSVGKKTIKIMDPAKGNVTMTLEKFASLYIGKIIVFKPNATFKKGGKKETFLDLLKNRLWDYRLRLAGLIVLDFALTALGYFYLKTTQRFLDEVIDSNEPKIYGPLTFLLIGLFAGKVIFTVWKTLATYRVSKKMSANSASDLFGKLLRMPAAFYEQHAIGELGERLDNNAQLDRNLITSVIPRIIDACTSIVYIVLMFTYNIPLAIICLAFEALHVLIVFLMQKRIAVVLRSQTSSSGKANSSAFNTFNNIDTIKSMGSERFYFNLWNSSREENQNDQQTSVKMQQKIETLTMFHNTIMSAIFLFLGAYFIINGRFAFGMLHAFQGIFNIVKNALKGVISANNSLQRARTHIERAQDISNRDSQEVYALPEGEIPDKLSGSLKVQNLNYRYNSGDPLVLKNINLEVKQGEMIAIVGASGCGKSTLVKIISGIYQQETGEVLYDGKKRPEIPDIVFHSSVTSVDQEVCVFDSTISNNLKMWDPTIENFEMILAARDAQIHARILEEKTGYDTVMQFNGNNFSGGEIQRLELARALSQEPTLLLLDEFTSALDAITEEKIFDAVRYKGTTCIIIAHRLSTIVNCDRIYVMDHGEIVEQGTHSELYALGGLYYQLVSKQ